MKSKVGLGGGLPRGQGEGQWLIRGPAAKVDTQEAESADANPLEV